LQAQVISGLEVRLSWAASTNPQTGSSGGLNYNLRVGTTPGGQQIIASQSDIATSYRRAPLPGNAGTCQFLARQRPHQRHLLLECAGH
jgi:hypothetical protein